MAIDWQILGGPGADNALLVTVDSGQSLNRILFDCGGGCLDGLQTSLIQSIDHLCFSHFHMDHVSGFDTFFRHNYNRPEVPVEIWGPPETLEVMEHRFRGFVWNLHADQPGEWIVHEIGADNIEAARFFTREAFAETHRLPDRPFNAAEIHRDREFRLEAMLLPHSSTSTVGYRLVEPDRVNVDATKLKSRGLLPGPWLQSLTDASVDDAQTVSVDGRDLSVGQLREDLLATTPGDSLAYLTDFRIEPDQAEWKTLIEWLDGTKTILCECQHHLDEVFAAQKTGHMTPDLAGQLAADSGATGLVLHHVSRRYQKDQRSAILASARERFPATEFPAGWD